MKALIVDDEPDIREELSEFVEDLGIAVETAVNGEEALAKFYADPDIAIVLSDLMMPGLNGLDMLENMNIEPEGKARVKRVIFMTGNGNTQSVIRAMHLGATEFLLKPVDLNLLEKHILSARKWIAAERSRRAQEAALKEQISFNEVEISSLSRDIERAYSEALACLAAAAEYKDPETGQHITRIGEYAAVVAKELGWDRDRCDMIRLAAPLHDVGKVGMRDDVLLKEAPLDPAEAKHMREHPETGYHILSSSEYPVMKMAARIAYCHHERWDGSGYPRALKGTEIPLEASITSLVDVYDALRSKRPYKSALSHNKVMHIIKNGDGRTKPEHFRPEVLLAFLKAEDKMAAIFDSFKDEDAPPGTSVESAKNKTIRL